jgi:DNA-directed RNA polymerase subunit H (RpoH/RPB5)
MSDEFDLKNLFITKKIITSFLSVNNYINDEPDYETMTFEDFSIYSVSLFENYKKNEITSFLLKNNISLTPRTIHTKKYKNKFPHNPDILLYYYDNTKKGEKEKDTIGINHINTFMQLSVFTSSNISILISSKEPTPASKSALYKSFTTLNTDTDLNRVFYSKYFDEKKLLDLSKYIFSPKILEIKRGPEVKKFLRENNIKPTEIKKIRVSDPIASFYLLLPGDIVLQDLNIGLSEMYNPVQREYCFVI